MTGFFVNNWPILIWSDCTCMCVHKLRPTDGTDRFSQASPTINLVMYTRRLSAKCSSDLPAWGSHEARKIILAINSENDIIISNQNTGKFRSV